MSARINYNHVKAGTCRINENALSGRQVFEYKLCLFFLNVPTLVHIILSFTKHRDFLALGKITVNCDFVFDKLVESVLNCNVTTVKNMILWLPFYGSYRK